MSSPYVILGNRPLDQWKRRKLNTKGLKEDLENRLNEAVHNERESTTKSTGSNPNEVNQSELPLEQATECDIVFGRSKDLPETGGSLIRTPDCNPEIVIDHDRGLPSEGRVMEVNLGQETRVETTVDVGETIEPVRALHGTQRIESSIVVKFVFGLISLICAFIGSMSISGSFDCIILEQIIGGDDCFSRGYKLVRMTLGFWVISNCTIGLLHWMDELGKESDFDGREYASFFLRFFIEAVHIGVGIVCFVAATRYTDKVPKKGGTAMCAWMLASVTFTSLIYMKYDDFGIRDAVGAIFLGVLYMRTKDDLSDLIAAASACFIGRMLIFLWKEFKKWRRTRSGSSRVRCARILRMLELDLRENGNLNHRRSLLIYQLKAELTASD